MMSLSFVNKENHTFWSSPQSHRLFHERGTYGGQNILCQTGTDWIVLNRANRWSIRSRGDVSFSVRINGWIQTDVSHRESHKWSYFSSSLTKSVQKPTFTIAEKRKQGKFLSAKTITEKHLNNERDLITSLQRQTKKVRDTSYWFSHHGEDPRARF